MDESLTVVTVPCPQEGVLVLRVAGVIDLSTVDQLRTQLHQRLTGSHRTVILDYTEVSFLAACGIGLLAELVAWASAEGVTLRLVASTRPVLRVLGITRLDGLLPGSTSVAEALARRLP